jgi:hypothetical protein
MEAAALWTSMENASGALCSSALPGSAFPTAAHRAWKTPPALCSPSPCPDRRFPQAPTGPAASLYIFLNLRKGPLPQPSPKRPRRRPRTEPTLAPWQVGATSDALQCPRPLSRGPVDSAREQEHRASRLLGVALEATRKQLRAAGSDAMLRDISAPTGGECSTCRIRAQGAPPAARGDRALTAIGRHAQTWQPSRIRERPGFPALAPW